MDSNLSIASNRIISQATFFNRVYAWMASGIALTGVIAYLIHNSAALHRLVYQPSVIIPLFVLQLIMVLTISAGAKKLKAGLSTAIFILYAAITGITLSGILELYAQQTIYQAFGITAGTFAVFSIYGFITKKDLTSIGTFCMMAIWGLIAALIFSMFFANTWLEYAINIGGILIFTGLTAYDTQKLKEMSDDPDMAPVGSLILYLDFINLFLYIVRLMGGNKD